jgi:hypothetical protein
MDHLHLHLVAAFVHPLGGLICISALSWECERFVDRFEVLGRHNVDSPLGAGVGTEMPSG